MSFLCKIISFVRSLIMCIIYFFIVINFFIIYFIHVTCDPFSCHCHPSLHDDVVLKNFTTNGNDDFSILHTIAINLTLTKITIAISLTIN